jgi:hypothetical protein
MADDQDQRPASLLPYEAWTEEALRHVVLRALQHVLREGLPGGHHFYISFRTDAHGVIVPPRLRAQYPREMTIVLQHQFWDLSVDEATAQFSVGLSFGGVPSLLTIPLAAITAFADPEVNYGMRFNTSFQAAPGDALLPEPEPVADATATPAAEPPAAEPQVVSLDAFRRRGPAKDAAPEQE